MSTQVNPNDPLQIFHAPIGLGILSYLTARDLNNCSLVSKLWNSFANSEALFANSNAGLKPIIQSVYPALNDADLNYDKTKFKTLKQFLSLQILNSENELVGRIKKFIETSSRVGNGQLKILLRNEVRPFSLSIITRIEKDNSYSIDFTDFVLLNLTFDPLVMNRPAGEIIGTIADKHVLRNLTLKENHHTISNSQTGIHDAQDYTISVYRKNNTSSCLVRGIVHSPVNTQEIFDEEPSSESLNSRITTVLTAMIVNEALKMAHVKEIQTQMITTKQSSFYRTLARTMMTPFVLLANTSSQNKGLILVASAAAVGSIYYAK